MEIQEHARPRAETSWRLEPRAAALERFVERRQTWILVFWSLLYFGGTMLRASAKPFWYDEILTLLEARQPSLSASMRALGDVDWMPPASHLTFYLTNRLAGSGEVAFRIPALIGFWVFCLCLFFFARRRVSIFFALMAMLLPYASAFQSYSYEARSYAIVLGFCGIALVCWQAAVDRTRRLWPLAGLAVGIAGAISYQYWAVLIYLPLAGAEVYCGIRRRHIDWPMWTALAAGAAPLVASLFVILHGLETWSPSVQLRVHPGEYLDFYRVVFRVYFAFAIPAALLLGAWFVLGGRKEKPEGEKESAIPDHEWVAATLLLLIPVAAISIALAVPPHAFNIRYATPAIAGYALLGSFLAAHFARRRSTIGMVCVVAALVPFVYLMTQPGHFESSFQRARGLEQQLQSGPVVVEDFIGYVQLWYYTPDPLKPRLLFLTGQRTESFFGEFSKLGVPILAYRDFALPGREFLLYPNRKGNLQRRVVDEGGTVEPVESSGRRAALRARIAR